MSRSFRALIAITIATLLGVTSGCGFAPNASLSPGAHRLAQSQEAMAGSFSTRRVVVTYKSGGADRAKSALSRMGMRMVNDLPQLGLSVLALPASANRTTVLASIAAQPDVTSVEPDSRVRVNYRPTDPDMLIGRLNGEYDAFRSQLYKAWDLTLGDPRLVVAVVDTGVDLDHPELRSRLVPGKNFVTQVETEGDDGTTQLIDLKDNGPMDDNGHGTHVAGIIAAGESNGQGIAGIAPRVRIMPIKTLAYNESGFSSDVANGVIWAVDHGARIINMSLGAYGGSKALEKAVAYAQSKGAVVVAAMGNDRDDPDKGYGESPSYPAALPGVIAVGATDGADRSAYFSNAGRWISVSAPGDSIYSTTPTKPVKGHVGQDYDYMSGTSMATPVVSGVIALMLSLTPNLSPAQIKSRLEQTSDDVGVPGFDTATGRGRVNPFKALGGSY